MTSHPGRCEASATKTGESAPVPADSADVMDVHIDRLLEPRRPNLRDDRTSEDRLAYIDDKRQLRKRPGQTLVDPPPHVTRLLVVRVSSSWFLVVLPASDMPSDQPSHTVLLAASTHAGLRRGQAGLLPAQGQVVLLALLDLDDVWVVVAEIVLQQRDLPSSGEGADPGGRGRRSALLGLGQS